MPAHVAIRGRMSQISTSLDGVRGSEGNGQSPQYSLPKVDHESNLVVDGDCRCATL